MNLLLGIGCRSLMYDVLQAYDQQACSVKTLIRIGDLFGMNDGAIRVTLASLVKEGIILSPQRSFYQMNTEFHQTNYAWLMDKYGYLDHWQHNFLTVSYLSAPRSINGSQSRRRDEILNYLGFVEYQRNFYLRPNNLSLSRRQIYRYLQQIEPELHPQFMLCQFFEEDLGQVHQQWNINALQQQYQEYTPILKSWLHNQQHKPMPTITKEAFLMSRQIIRSICQDPLLPHDWLASESRQQFIETSQRFLLNKNDLWRRLSEH